jgi:thiamine biosynthesis lipoprotein
MVEKMIFQSEEQRAKSKEQRAKSKEQKFFQEDFKKVFSRWTLVFGLLFLSSCTQPLYRDKFVISGTYLEIVSPYREAGRIVYDEFKRWDKVFNSYRSDSELSQLNNSYNKAVKVSPELIEVIKLSQKVYKLSGGAFDISCGAVYEFWKDLMKKERVDKFPSKEEIEDLRKSCGMENIEINLEDKTVKIKKEGLKIDLGGIAKGYIVDEAVSRLKEKGIDSALINAGGDIYCLGKNKGRGWRVGIQDPQEAEGIIETEELVNEAIATSGNYEQFFEYNSQRFSHLIDPRSGYPVRNGILSVSVISKDCATADSFATAFFIMGLERIKEFIASKPFYMKIFVVAVDGNGKHRYIF